MIAFISIGKTGGKTISRILRREYGMRHCDVLAWRIGESFSAESYRRLRWLYPRLKSVAGHAVRPYSDLEEACPEVRYYTMLRDPLQRCASHYNQQIRLRKKTLSFEEWIKDERYRNRQTRFLAGRCDADAAIEAARSKLFFVGLTDRYAESLALLKRAIGDERLCMKYPSYDAVGDHRFVRKLLFDKLYKKPPGESLAKEILADPQKRALLIEANQADLKLYEAVTREVFPAQIERWGEHLEDEVRQLQTDPPSPFNLRWACNRLRRNLVYKPAVSCYRLLTGQRLRPTTGTGHVPGVDAYEPLNSTNGESST